MADSRVTNSARNVMAAWGGQAVYAVMTFATRAVLAATLGQVYVGLETLFTNLLTILTLADLGVGSAMVFALYEPLAKGDEESVKSIMRLFKRCYIAIGCVIICIGAGMTPFVDVLLGADAPDIAGLRLFFFCFVVNTGVSYFFSYKGSLMYADQKNYLVYIIQYSIMTLMCAAQIAVLMITQDYLLFLVCMIASTVIQNIIIVARANKMYPYLKDRDVRPIDRGVLTTIKKNIFGLLLHKIGGACATPLSNIIITYFIGLATEALYGNYLLFTSALERVVVKVFDSIVASVGNLGATEAKERQYEVFQTTFFVNAFLYAMISVALACILNPLVTLLFGEDWCFEAPVVLLIALLFYVRGMRNAGQAFTSAYGLYWQTRFKPLIEAVFLPLLAIALVGPLGLSGVLIASIASSLLISTLYEGWAVYKFALEQPLSRYARRFALYGAITVVVGLAAYMLCAAIPLSPLPAFFVYGVIGLAIPGLAFWLAFRNSRELAETLSLAGRVLAKLLHRR